MKLHFHKWQKVCWDAYEMERQEKYDRIEKLMYADKREYKCIVCKKTIYRRSKPRNMIEEPKLS